MKIFTHYTSSPNTTELFDFNVIPVYKKAKRTFIAPPSEDSDLPVSLALEQTYWEPLYYFLEEQRTLMAQLSPNKQEALRAFPDLPF